MSDSLSEKLVQVVHFVGVTVPLILSLVSSLTKGGRGGGEVGCPKDDGT